MAKSTAAKKTAASSSKSTIPAKQSSNGMQEGRSQRSLSSQDTGSLEKFFLDGLKDIYWAEKALTKALPKMQKAATTQELKSAFVNHLAQTKEQIVRLESVFEISI